MFLTKNFLIIPDHLFFNIYLFSVCVCMYACLSVWHEHTHMLLHFCGGQSTIWKIWFFYSIMWFQGIEFRSSVLVAGTMTHWAIFADPWINTPNCVVQIYQPNGYVELWFVGKGVSIYKTVWVEVRRHPDIFLMIYCGYQSQRQAGNVNMIK